MRQLRLLMIFWLGCCSFTAVLADGVLSATYPKALLSDILVQPGEYVPLPRSSSSFWRDSIPEVVRQSYVRYGERYLGQPWPALPASLFAEFKTVGNRVRYEEVNFAKRRHLAALAIAEVMEGKGRFLSNITDGLLSFMEETWWGIPAHYGHAFPIPESQPVDLFNAETAGLLAWTTYLFSDSLDARSPLIRRRMTTEMNRRLLTPALNGKDWWKTAGMNWNPWICSNWLACVLIFETDRERQLSAVSQIEGCLDAFMAAYPADGGCDEGPGYWDRAAASLYESLNLLKSATGGRIDMSKDPKLRAMGSYVYKTYIGGGYCTNYADAHDNKALQQVNIVYPFGRYLDDPLMRGFARYLWQGDGKAADAYDLSGNFPTLGRELFFLRHFGEFASEEVREPLLDEVWLPDLQIMTTRNKHGLFLAMKGGHNGESHNHNDVGSIIVYADARPLLIDPGVGEYTSKTFSHSRYSIWTMQSGYHNLPQINGVDQRDGKEYHASDIAYLKGQLTLDLATAYPPEAKVLHWRRTASLRQGKQVEVTEDYALSAITSPTRLMFLTPVHPVLQSGKVVLGNHEIIYDTRQLTAAVEDISPLLDPLLQKIWGKEMYRIVLTINTNDLKGKIHYRIR